MTTTILGENSLEGAKQLVNAIESGNETAAVQVLQELVRSQEATLFQEIGRLARDLHDSLTNFASDERVSEMATREMPDARERLNYVVDMTENAAHQTIGAVENALPVSDALQARGREFREQWQALPESERIAANGEVFDVAGFVDSTIEDAGAINASLSEVLMAQSYQDLSGQVIRKVISLVSDVEEKLVELVCLASGTETPKSSGISKQSSADDARGNGPSVPGVDDACDAVAGQGDVDELLSSLGF